MSNICVVFTCNKPYFNKFIQTCSQLFTNGKYTGNVCLFIGDDLNNDNLLNCEFIKKNKIIIKYFPNINFTENFLKINNGIHTSLDNRHITKKFQWHKMYLFDTFFKQWEYIFYLDCGVTIFSDISPMLNEACENTLLAHSDSYPTYEWKLSIQFDTTHKIFEKLNSDYKLEIDYFQTTIMLYDTKIIENDTLQNLFDLMFKYPISRTNEQAIISLYFTNIKPLFKQIKIHNEQTHFYDYLSRNNRFKYIMLKLC